MSQKLFNSSFAKVSRAKSTFEELKNKIDSFNDTKPYQLRNEFDNDTKENILVYYPTQEIPTEFSIMIGEIAHHLRSALDLAVYDLTINEVGSPLKNTEFPIFEDKELFFEKKKDGQPTNRSGLYKIRGLRDTTIRVIEAVQPYNIRKESEAPILAILHEFDIVDKHRSLHICRRLARSTNLKLIRDAVGCESLSISSGGDFDQKSVIGRLKLTKPDNHDYLDAEVVIHLAFDKKTYWEFKVDIDVIEILTSLIDGVTKLLLMLENSLSKN